MERPTGAIELLISNYVLSIHPRYYVDKGNLKVSTSLFGTGFILTGSHPEIKSESITWSEDVSAIRHSAGTSPHMVNRITVFPNYNYFEHDILGVQPPKRCFKCRRCKECSFRGHKLSQQEQYEQKLSTILSSSHSLHHIHAEDPSIPKDQKK